MRYASIRKMDISNGEGIGVSLFVQGCPIHCVGCFNEKTWDFDGGNEWNESIQKEFVTLSAKDYVKRVSILGGEPMMHLNFSALNNLVKQIRIANKHKEKMAIWIYTGYHFEELVALSKHILDLDELLRNIDVLVDGEYIHELSDKNLKWKGSSNQRVIDMKASMSPRVVIKE